ncbi:hypothetical protein BTJ39_12295 [Izhakiella australiensis]|uniref:Polyketide cyclase n=1 Tax=Izhakiella australiensis TaxID=1926881 RepID=A0A1S8YLR9_9GAMM|nr:SRPBCC domain-containing protein [Izhakiella australiensis]OON39807.1 hypothetical protein BTJ39_12295 [Izhakiella australiensis]
MTDVETKNEATELVLEYRLDAAPEKVWRAVTIAEYRQQWLPDDTLHSPEPVSSIPGKEVRYRMKEGEAPWPASEVRFTIDADGDGGTILTINHRPLTESQRLPAANDDAVLMMAA